MRRKKFTKGLITTPSVPWVHSEIPRILLSFLFSWQNLISENQKFLPAHSTLRSVSSDWDSCNNSVPAVQGTLGTFVSLGLAPSTLGELRSKVCGQLWDDPAGWAQISTRVPFEVNNVEQASKYFWSCAGYEDDDASDSDVHDGFNVITTPRD